ncbi:hypothetical protein IM660_01330 [Ruania alkalisoli]|uniref:Uncharacterized protein n=1 Tax=Ruania alkalisoli TaxID=2779775 RepID=A0A7M1STS5_9MICO|nr:hypothetical protein [Ruania alkalisoli]QOR70989.1 hypothetical protein IM660_01330 [Ruania alkalisoli]
MPEQFEQGQAGPSGLGRLPLESAPHQLWVDVKLVEKEFVGMHRDQVASGKALCMAATRVTAFSLAIRSARFSDELIHDVD